MAPKLFENLEFENLLKIDNRKFFMFGFSRNVFILSLASFLNDIGGETIKKTLSLFLYNVLGVKTSIVGLVEGISESTETIFQTFSGYLSDKLKKRKPFVTFGYFLTLFGRLNLFWVNSWAQVLFFRFLDRAGKGINRAPRDALISESTEDGKRGRSFGFHRMMDNAGSFIGLLIAAAVVYLSQKGGVLITKETFRLIVLLAVAPGIIAFLLLAFFVAEKTDEENKRPFSFKFADLPFRYKYFLFLSFLFALGNSSDAFLILKTQKLGMPLFGILLVIAGFSFLASILSLPAGNLSDKFGRKKVLLLGWLAYAVIYFNFALATKLWQVVILFISYGIYYGLTEGVAKAYITDLIPQEKRATAFGIYNTVVGLTLIPASVIAGYLWQIFSPAAAFYFGGILALLASIGLIIPKFINITS